MSRSTSNILKMRFRNALAALLLVLLSFGVVQTAAGEGKSGDDVDLLLSALEEDGTILPEGLELPEDFNEFEDHGQDEERSLDEFLEEEKEFFRSRDEDGSGGLSLDEFKAHYLQSMIDAASLLPDPVGEPVEEEGMKGGHHAVGEDDEAHALFAFQEFDVNGDGTVTWEEWHLLMFHEAPQEPDYRDGSPSKQQGEAHMRRLFKEWDLDKDGLLAREEVVGMFKAQRDERASASEQQPAEQDEEGPPSLSDDEIEMVTYQIFDDKDGDGDMRMTLEEWLQGGSYL
mmetsp:Transcript_20725/g.42125  ORF Transcript_20725/g.42125 Transcript_20725/m.42125 type:complete len:286 (-) Transcript_20725:427-1284(-)